MRLDLSGKSAIATLARPPIYCIEHFLIAHGRSAAAHALVTVVGLARSVHGLRRLLGSLIDAEATV